MKKIILITSLIFAALIGKAQITVTIIPGDITVCYGDSVELKAVIPDSIQNPGDTISYRWSTNAVDTLPTLDLKNLTQEITVICTVTIKNGKTIEGSDTVNIGVYPQFNKGSISAGNQTFCSGTQQIKIVEVNPAKGKSPTYQWKYSSNGTDTDIPNSTNSDFDLKMTLLPGVYSFTRKVSDGCGNSAVSEGIYTVTVLEPPTLTLDSGNSIQEICIGGEISDLIYKYGGSATGVSVIWEKQEPIGISYIDQNSKITFSGTPTQSGNFPFKIETKSNSACTAATVTGSFNVKPLPVFAAYADPSEVCAGSTATLRTITDEKDLEFEWFDGEKSLGTDSELSVTPEINQGTKSYKVIATKNGSCPKEVTVPLNVLESPKLNKIVAMPENNPTLLLYPNPEPNFYYQWYENDKAISGANGQFYYPGSKGIDQSAKYKVYIYRIDPNSCGRFSEEYPEKKLVETQSISSGEGFAISPNPANLGNINIKFNNDVIEIKEEAVIFLMNYEGRTLYTTKINSLSEQKISTPLAKGLYFVAVRTDLGKIYTEKLIVK